MRFLVAVEMLEVVLEPGKDTAEDVPVDDGMLQTLAVLRRAGRLSKLVEQAIGVAYSMAVGRDGDGCQKPKALIDGVKSVTNVRSDRLDAHLQYF